MGWVGRSLRATAFGLVALVAAVGLTSTQTADAAATSVNLLAGQNTVAGTVSTEVVGDNLVVTYTAAPGWSFTETHLWVGSSLSTLPTNKAGNPQIGQFPYVSGNISGATTSVVTVSLASLGASCGDTLLAASHAAMTLRGADGSVVRTETGWGAGTRITAKGSWATSFAFTVNCPPPPPPSVVADACETAWALGDDTFASLDIATRWGWVLTVDGPVTAPIYAAAGGNNLEAGTLVGSLTVTPGATSTQVTFTMLPGFSMDETHLYVGTTLPETAAPGQLGNLHDLTSASGDTYTVSITGSTLYVAAHAVVCGQYR